MKYILNDKFKRSKYNAENINIKNIYPKGWFLLVFIIEMFLAMLIIYYYKIESNYMTVSICMVLFYLVALGEFALRYIIKDKYLKNGYSMGVHTPYYHKVIKLLLVVNIGMAVASFVNLFVHNLTHISKDAVYDYSWRWFALIFFLICFEPFNDMTSGFFDSFFLSDRYVVDYSQITEIRIVKERITTKGTVCEIELYKGPLKVGKDRVFEEDLVQLKKLPAIYINEKSFLEERWVYYTNQVNKTLIPAFAIIPFIVKLS